MRNPGLTFSTAPPLQTGFRSSASDPEEQEPINLTYASRSTISSNNYNNNGTPAEADIRALLRSGAPPPGVDTGPGQQAAAQDADPMMRMLQQMMGGLGGESEEGGPERLPPALAAMLSNMPGGGNANGTSTPGQANQPAAVPSTSASIWRILHAISALVLGIYLSTHATFSATSRLADPRSTAPPPASPASGIVAHGPAPREMFWMFAVTELVLQGSRMVLEQGRGQEMPGWLGMIGSLLPEPWRGWVKLGMRYRGIWSTLVEDSMVALFVLGVVGWWRGLGG